MPVATGPGQTAHLQPQHETHVIQANLGQQSLESRTPGDRLPALTEIIVDDQHPRRGPSQSLGPLAKPILHLRRLAVFADLFGAGLAHVDKGIAVQMPCVHLGTGPLSLPHTRGVHCHRGVLRRLVKSPHASPPGDRVRPGTRRCEPVWPGSRSWGVRADVPRVPEASATGSCPVSGGGHGVGCEAGHDAPPCRCLFAHHSAKSNRSDAATIGRPAAFEQDESTAAFCLRAHHGEGRDLHAEEPGQRLQAVPNPGPAMIVGLTREGIDPAEESPAHHALHTVIDPNFIRDHDLRAIPPCHARILHIGSRCLGPVGHRPSQRHDGQMYQGWSRLSSSQRKLWVAPNVDHPHVVFDFTTDRSGAGPERMLKGYQGYLQADAYSAYDRLYADGTIVEVGCWMHARRKFFEAKTSDPLRAHQALAWIRGLYAVEREAKTKELDDAQRLTLRQEQSRPILETIKEWLDKEVGQVLPKSPMAEAIGYALNHWKALERYLEAGFLEIDNGASERGLRPVAVGRNNWLFLGSEAGGKTAAILMSLCATCKRVGIDPLAYLRDVLERISTHPASRIAELVPDQWRKIRAGPDQGESPSTSAGP